MNKITIYKSSGKYKGFSSKGHAGYADSGLDIVCAAISVLVINTINSIETFTNDKIAVKTNEKMGIIECRFVSEISCGSILLMDSLILGLKGIQTDYNSEYLILIFEEV